MRFVDPSPQSGHTFPGFDVTVPRPFSSGISMRITPNRIDVDVERMIDALREDLKARLLRKPALPLRSPERVRNE